MKNPKIKFLEEIEIGASTFTMVWNPDTNGGSFAYATMEIMVGTKDYDKDPCYTFHVLSHEIMEVILDLLGVRYANPKIEGDYLFSFSHNTFELAIALHTAVLSKFIKFEEQ